MSSSTIAGGAPSPQSSRGLLSILLELDEAASKSLLTSSEGSTPRLPSPITGRLLDAQYDPARVLNLVDEIWPERVYGHRGSGRKSEDPLPLVCFLLPCCDPEYGFVPNLLEAYRRLREDEEYRGLSGYVGRLPSESVFRKVAGAVRGNWPRFKACAASPGRLEALRVEYGIVPAQLGDPAGKEMESPYGATLRQLGWNGCLPPGYREDEKESKVLRVVGKPRGRCCISSEDSSLQRAGDGEKCSVSPDAIPSRWPGYNSAQTYAVQDVKRLLGGFSDIINIVEDKYRGRRARGRPEFPLGHVFFSVVQKAFSGLASRPHESLLRESVELGYLRNVPPLSSPSERETGHVSEVVRIPQFTTVCSYFRSPWLTPLLLEMVTVAALPLRGLEREFAVDGTGWSTRWYDRWLDHRLSEESDRQKWVKLHLVVGCETNVVARAAISPGSHHDGPYFRPLVTETAKHFNVEMVLADMGYSSRDNHRVGGELEVQVRIPFQDRTRPPSGDGSDWDRDLRYFNENYETFLKEYHRRSNVESTNGALKMTLPEKIRSQGGVAQTNEALAKLLAYNIRVLGREDRMRDLVPDLPALALCLEDCVREVIEMRRSHQCLGQAA